MSAALDLYAVAEGATIAKFLRPLFRLEATSPLVRDSVREAVESVERLAEALRMYLVAEVPDFETYTDAGKQRAREFLRACSELRAGAGWFVDRLNETAADQELRPLWDRFAVAQQKINRDAEMLAEHAAKALGIKHRYPIELAPDQEAQLARSVPVDFEAYMRWLETGEGSDPCGERRT